MSRLRSVFAVQSASGRSTPWTDQRLINLYAELGGPDTKSKAVVHGTPGLKTFADSFGGGKLRGATVQQGTVYVVAGTTLYSVNSTGTTTAISGSIPGTAKVKLVPGRDNIAILQDNGDLYAYDGTSVAQVTDADLFTASDITYQDGYLIVAKKDSDQFQISSQFDFTAYDALDFATSEALGDELVAALSDRRELWLLNAKTTEIWYNSGASDFPFVRRDVIQRGCRTRDTVVNFDNTIIWLGDDGVVYRASGYTPQRISTHAVEYAIETDPDRGTTARAFEYTQEGHKFYVLKLQNETWAYDAATQLWHERESYGASNYRVDGTIEAFGRVLAWDDEKAKLYDLDLETYTEDGGIIQRTAQTPVIHADRRRGFMSLFEMEMEVGVGLTTGQGSDPQAMLSYSNDGGKTWSNEKWRSIGKIGEYIQRVRWHRLGSFRQRVMQMVISDPVKVAIYAMTADIETGTDG